MRSHRRGWTFIELLTVLVVIGVLVGFAIPRFTDTRGKSLTATLEHDLRNLALAQEAHFFTRGFYTTTLDSLLARESEGVTIAIVGADSAGWAATATHPMASRRTCAVYHGRPPAVPPPATQEGMIACE